MSKNTPTKPYDSHQIGIILGIVAPFLVLVIIYLVKFNPKFSFPVFLTKMYQVNALSPLLSLCAIINLGIFFLLYKYWYNNAARGVIIATFLLTFIVLIFKLLN